MDGNGSIRCAPCERAFSSRGHLHRHQRLLHHHVNADSIPCPFCHSPFARIDVMRRHANKCAERAHRDTPKPSKRGPKKTCCVRCSRMKVACDKGDPCSRCKFAGFPCNYTVLTKKTNIPSTPSIIDVESNKTGDPDVSSHAKHIKTSIPFLLCYADPQTSFEDLMKATNEDPVGYPEDKEDPPDISDSRPILDSPIDLSTSTFLHDLCGLFDFPESPGEFFEFDPLLKGQEQQQSTTVQLRVDQLFGEFELHNSHTRAKALDEQCGINVPSRNTYAAADLESTIQNFFDYATRHTPIISRSQFHIHTISSHLFLAILAAGGQLPTFGDSPFSSLGFFESVQEFIFDQQILQNPHVLGSPDHPPGEDILEILQAALIMLCTQVTMGDNPVSHSNCKARFSKLVAAIRALSLTKVRRYHNFDDDVCHLGLKGLSNRKRFLREEAMTRLAWMAFLLDIQFVLFLRVPPQFTITEMVGDLPCADKLYTEAPGEEVELEVQSGVESLSWSTYDLPRLSLSALIGMLMQPSMPHNSELYKTNARGLFSGICGLHSIIYSAQTTHSMPHMRPVLDRALDRWRSLWDNLHKTSGKTELEMLGFMKHALEFWVIAKGLLGADPHVLHLEHVDSPSKGDVSAIYRRVFNGLGKPYSRS